MGLNKQNFLKATPTKDYSVYGQEEKDNWAEEKFGRKIEFNEIVFDCDNRELGFHGINFTGINLARAGYYFQIWFTKGGKSPHLHVKGIKGLSSLEAEQLKKYKKLFIRKYTPEEYLEFMDIKVCNRNHRIVTENSIHYKYNKIKKLCGVWNEGNKNSVEQDLYEEALQEEKVELHIDPTANLLKDKLPMTTIAKHYGLKGRGKMFICPFHEDKSPSLSLSDELGVFNCFGCNVSGDLIKFVQMLEDLK